MSTPSSQQKTSLEKIRLFTVGNEVFFLVQRHPPIRKTIKTNGEETVHIIQKKGQSNYEAKRNQI